MKMKEVYNKVEEEIRRRINIITRKELHDNNLVKAINTKVIPVAAYPMKFFKFTQSEVAELNRIVKRNLRKNNMLDNRQAMKNFT